MRFILTQKKCTGCGECIDVCKLERITANKDVLPVIQAVRSGKKDVYVLIAPAFTDSLAKKQHRGGCGQLLKLLDLKEW